MNVCLFETDKLFQKPIIIDPETHWGSEIDGLLQDCSNSSANALKLLLS